MFGIVMDFELMDGTNRPNWPITGAVTLMHRKTPTHTMITIPVTELTL